MKRAILIIGGELRNLLREPELSFLLLAPFLIGLLLRVGIPLAALFLQRKTGFDLLPHIPFLLGYIMLVPPLLCGMVIGLRLLDDRDGGILAYIGVTPPARTGYLALRLAVPVLFSVPLAAMLPTLAGYPFPSASPVILTAAVAALEAPLITLFLAAFAGNKVEAMALGKVSGMLFLAPLAGYLWDSPWLLPAALLPPYWSPLALARAAAGETWWPLLMGGLLVHIPWLILFWTLFRRRGGG